MLRVVRVLRPLRTVSASPTMRVLVGTVFSSLPRLGNVSLLLCFFLTFFGQRPFLLSPCNFSGTFFGVLPWYSFAPQSAVLKLNFLSGTIRDCLNASIAYSG